MICENCGNDEVCEGQRECSDCLMGCVECHGPGPLDDHGQCFECHDDLTPDRTT